MTWAPSSTFHRHKLLWLTLATLGGTGGAVMLFLHLMQTSAPFAEAVAKLSPELANTFSCTCPFCSAACEPPEDQQGLGRFDNNFPI